jgi:hypothetical protein
MARIVEMASSPPSVTVQVGAAQGTGQRSENMMFRMSLSFTYLKNTEFYCNLEEHFMCRVENNLSTGSSSPFSFIWGYLFIP